MKPGLFFLKALNNLSLVFIIVNFSFGLIGCLPPWHWLLFPAEIFFSLCVYFLKNKRPGKACYLLLVPALAPLPFLPLTFIPYVAVCIGAAFYVGTLGIKEKTDYWFMTGLFSKGLGIVAALTLFSWLRGGANLLNRDYTSYILIFLVTSVLLLRTLRHLLHGGGEADLRKINLIYSFIILISSFILGNAAVRSFPGSAFAKAYAAFVEAAVYLLSWLLLPLAYLINWLVHGLFVLGWKGPQAPPENVGTPLPPRLPDASGSYPDILQKLQRLLHIPVDILIIALLMFGLFKLLRRLNDSARTTEEYREEREITLPSGKNTPSRPRIRKLFPPRNGAERVRHYYRQFLSLALKRELNILHSDTTLEIQEKGKACFGQEDLEAMRAIYLQVRYDGKPCPEETANVFRTLFNRLPKNNKNK